nr:MAG TPA: hypothetical protein [Caudoviricetes sp.]DAY21289.1 MAG TPA: hypothetical protein [Caudoviricetes sp.]
MERFFCYLLYKKYPLPCTNRVRGYDTPKRYTTLAFFIIPYLLGFFTILF